MRWFNWKRFAAAVAVLAGGVAIAAGQGKRMPLPEEVQGWLEDLPAAAGEIEPHSPAREAIEQGRLDEARDMLSFRPYDEAPLPEGFPAYTPVGVIEVKEYPAYRKAVGPSFWPLFQHIQKQGIPMTAPVEMADAPRGNDGAMAFLYQSTSVGQEGPVDGVRVEDAPATTVASLGVRGRMTEQAADEARATLQAWLDGQSEYRAAGDEPFRLFGYNGPSVPDKSKYWEAQLTLEPVASDSSD
ncbi:heme-binding protein [Botrimarina sp.]|uniref:heme-binding protein n=1 Tax=Botrimarina sp. TaxID=2795802 RepID=UPI0032EAAA4A